MDTDTQTAPAAAVPDSRNVAASHLTPNGKGARTMDQWSDDARAASYSGENIGQRFARNYAKEHGIAVILWNDGHVTVIDRYEAKYQFS